MNLQKKIALAIIGLLSGCSVHKENPLPEPLEDLPPTVEEIEIDQNELQCLTENIYYEARNQGYKGMVLIANVTMNRVHSKKWKNKVCDVVKQKRTIGKRKVCQFSWVCQDFHKPPKVKQDLDAWATSSEIALEALRGSLPDLSNGATHYHTTKVKPVWRKSLEVVARTGDHIFYKDVQNPGYYI